jgi:hypothetical protein
MKQIAIFILLAFGAVMMVSAQGINRRSSGDPRNTAEKLTVTGNLTLVRGMIAVQSGDVTYMVPGLLRYAGFIDSLKEGAQVRLEGFAAGRQADSKTKILVVSKMTIAGKEYDLSMRQAWQDRNIQPRQRHQQFQRGQGPGYHDPQYNRGRRW